MCFKILSNFYLKLNSFVIFIKIRLGLSAGGALGQEISAITLRFTKHTAVLLYAPLLAPNLKLRGREEMAIFEKLRSLTEVEKSFVANQDCEI